MVLRLPGFPDPLEHLKKAELLDPRKDLGDFFPDEFLFFYFIYSLSGPVEVLENKIVPVIYGCIDCNPAAHIFEKLPEALLAFLKRILSLLALCDVLGYSSQSKWLTLLVFQEC